MKKRANFSHLSSSQDMSCQFNLGEIPLPNGLEEAVITNVGVLLCRGERIATSWQAVAACRLCWGNWGFNKAIHRRVLQKRHMSGNQKHPHPQLGTLIYIDTNTRSPWTSLAVWHSPKGVFLLLHWLHRHMMQQSAAVEVCVCQSWDIPSAIRDEPINWDSVPIRGSNVVCVQTCIRTCVWTHIRMHVYIN